MRGAEEAVLLAFLPDHGRHASDERVVVFGREDGLYVAEGAASSMAEGRSETGKVYPQGRIGAAF